MPRLSKMTRIASGVALCFRRVFYYFPHGVPRGNNVSTMTHRSPPMPAKFPLIEPWVARSGSVLTDDKWQVLWLPARRSTLQAGFLKGRSRENLGAGLNQSLLEYPGRLPIRGSLSWLAYLFRSIRAVSSRRGALLMTAVQSMWTSLGPPSLCLGQEPRDRFHGKGELVGNLTRNCALRRGASLPCRSDRLGKTWKKICPHLFKFSFNLRTADQALPCVVGIPAAPRAPGSPDDLLCFPLVHGFDPDVKPCGNILDGKIIRVKDRIEVERKGEKVPVGVRDHAGIPAF